MNDPESSIHCWLKMLFRFVGLWPKKYKLINEIQKCWTRINVDQGLADSKPPSSLSIPTTELYFGGMYITKICDHTVS